MPKSQAERTSEYEARTRIKARLFKNRDEGRRRGLRGGVAGDTSPEAQTLVAFFNAYPRCRKLPLSVNFGGEGYYSIVLEWPGCQYEAAAARVAMAEISSLKAVVESYKDGAGASWQDPAIESAVREEVAEMRRLGLWRP